jgi:phage baseplate assembly protein W
MSIETIKIARIYKDLDLNFTANPVTGDVAKKLDVNAVKQSILILLSTNFYERPFAPDKGANLRGFLFEQMSGTLASLIQNAIKNIIVSYEPRVRINSITVAPNYDGNQYDVILRYTVIGVDKPQTLTTSLKRLR